ncbi:hydroxysqualene dehydroxylase [Candidatus Poriferisocius sp.]|uniref:hydroxysqualene dehydroxylase n=1 Tax=Candidatus Poriferisocius sp. TaxID=3101276 RepID=UPI003B01F1C4
MSFTGGRPQPGGGAGMSFTGGRPQLGGGAGMSFTGGGPQLGGGAGMSFTGGGPQGEGSPGPRVAVVGGGLAGLAAAVAVADGGAAVTLYERAPRLGGATWSFRRNGRWFDNGQHVFMRCCTEYRAFLGRLGVDDLVVQQRRLSVPVIGPGCRPARIFRTGAPAPLHLARSLMGYKPLSVADRLRAVRTALALRRLDPDHPDTDGLSFGEWLRSRGESDQAVGGLWDLICLPTVNLRADDASLSLAVKVFRTGLLDAADAADLGWTRVPLAALHGDAATRVITARGGSIQLGARVEAVSEGPSVTVGGQRVDHDAVILAVPHDAVDGLLPPGTVPGQAGLAGLGVSPIVNVHFVFDRPVMDIPLAAALDSPIQFVFDRTEAAIWGGDGSDALGRDDRGEGSDAPPGTRGRGERVAPTGTRGEQVVAVSQSAAFDEIGDRPDEMIERYRLALCDLFPRAAEAEVVDAVVTREHRATFAGRPGTRRLRPGPTTAMSGLFLAGAWTDTGWPATMEGAVRSGHRAARLALEHYRRVPPATSPVKIQKVTA